MRYRVVQHFCLGPKFGGWLLSINPNILGFYGWHKKNKKNKLLFCHGTCSLVEKTYALVDVTILKKQHGFLYHSIHEFVPNAKRAPERYSIRYVNSFLSLVHGFYNGNILFHRFCGFPIWRFHCIKHCKIRLSTVRFKHRNILNNFDRGSYNPLLCSVCHGTSVHKQFREKVTRGFCAQPIAQHMCPPSFAKIRLQTIIREERIIVRLGAIKSGHISAIRIDRSGDIG